MVKYPLYTGDVPYLTMDQMREVDRAMIEDYHIDLMFGKMCLLYHLKYNFRRNYSASWIIQ